MESVTVTGPAKNLIEFCRRSRTASPAAAVSIATFHRGGIAPGQAPSPFVAAARENGIEVDILEERFRFDVRVIGQLRRVLEARAPDLVQTHNVKSHLLAGLLRRRRAFPWIAFHHGYTTTDLKMRVYNQFNRWSLPAADRVVTVCGAFAEDLVRSGVRRDRIRVRHNTIEPAPPITSAERCAARAQFGLPADAKVVLAVGRLSREKAHAGLIRAFAELRQKNAAFDARLVIVGDGPERPRLEGLAADRNVAGVVHFAGQQTVVRPYYAAADLLALPSHSEGSPNVLLEAMAYELPVVATAVGGIPEIVEDERSALLVPPGSVHELGEAMGRLLSRPELANRLVAAARLCVRDRHSPAGYATAILDIYRELLAATSPRELGVPS